MAEAWPKRLYALDISRMVAALGVVVWHWQHFAFVGTAGPGDWDRTGQPFYAGLKLFYLKGYFGVSYFLVLSGFVFFWLYNDPIRERTIGFLKFTFNRLSKLYPLYFLTLVAVALMQFLYLSRESHFFVYPNNGWTHFVTNLFLVQHWGLQSGFSCNGPAWFVSITMLLYLVFFLFAFTRLGRPSLCFLTSVAAAVATYYVPWRFYDACLGIAAFFLGGFVFQVVRALSRGSSRLKWAKWVVFGLTACSWVLVWVNYNVVDIGRSVAAVGRVGELSVKWFPIYMLFPLTVASMVLWELDRRPRLERWRWLGDMSYATYLLHFPLQLLWALAVSLGIVGAGSYWHWWSFLLFFVVLLALSYLTWAGFEKPVQAMVRRACSRRAKE
jgi:peptidoglycan/LPS O-acetylase OafA/YrhL